MFLFNGKKREARGGEESEIRPRHDWVVLVLIFGTVLLLLLVGSFVLFVTSGTQQIKTGHSSETWKMVNEKGLLDALKTQDEKAFMLGQALNNKPLIIDPSF